MNKENSFYFGLIKEINAVRRDPPAFGEKLLSFKQYFKGNNFKLPTAKYTIATQEGFEAFKEAAEVLKKTKPLKEMVASKGLGRIATDFLEKINHCDPDKIGEIDIDADIKKYGKFIGTFNNVMEFGSETPETIIISLIVSDGDAGRNNRDFILNPELEKIGMSSGEHDTYGVLTIIVSCTDFQNSYDKDDTETFGGLITIGAKPEPANAKTAKPNEKEKTPPPASAKDTKVNEKEKAPTPANNKNTNTNANAKTNEKEKTPPPANTKNTNTNTKANEKETIPKPEKKEEKVVVVKVENVNEKALDEMIKNEKDVVSFDKRERLVIERGVKKKKIIYIKKYKDGRKRKEAKYIVV